MYLDRMNYLEVEEYLKKHDSVLIVTGSTENHGKHMPLGTDTMIPSKIAEMLEEKYGSDIVIAPPLPYGCTEDLKGFPGTVSIGPELMTQVLNKICDNLFDYGFRHFVILNGHGGNSKSIENSGHHVYDRGGLLARVDWWLIAGQLNEAWHGGHGGGEETAGVMAVDESLIKYEYINDDEDIRNDLGADLPSADWIAVRFKGGNITIPRPLKNVTGNGWQVYGLDDKPSKADAGWGTEMLQAMADYTAEFIPVFEAVKR